MPQSPVPNTAQAVLNFVCNGEDARNVLHYQQAPDVPFDEINLDALAIALRDRWNTHIKPLVSNLVTLETVICRDLGSVPGAQREVAANLVGGNVGAILPNNVTCAITLRTAQAGRSGRGRIYHVGLTTNQVTGSRLSPAPRSSILTAYQQLSTLPPAGAAPEYQLVVVSRFANKLQRAQGIKNRVTSMTLDEVLDSQRRRLPGRGK